MDERFDIQAYMTRGVENIVSGALRATLRDLRESAFMVRFAAASTGISLQSMTFLLLCLMSLFYPMNAYKRSLFWSISPHKKL